MSDSINPKEAIQNALRDRGFSIDRGRIVREILDMGGIEFLEAIAEGEVETARRVNDLLEATGSDARIPARSVSERVETLRGLAESLPTKDIQAFYAREYALSKGGDPTHAMKFATMDDATFDSYLEAIPQTANEVGDGDEIDDERVRELQDEFFTELLGVDTQTVIVQLRAMDDEREQAIAERAFEGDDTLDDPLFVGHRTIAVGLEALAEEIEQESAND